MNEDCHLFDVYQAPPTFAVSMVIALHHFPVALVNGLAPMKGNIRM
jgi:hypothetical protein